MKPTREPQRRFNTHKTALIERSLTPPLDLLQRRVRCTRPSITRAYAIVRS